MKPIWSPTKTAWNAETLPALSTSLSAARTSLSLVLRAQRRVKAEAKTRVLFPKMATIEVKIQELIFKRGASSNVRGDRWGSGAASLPRAPRRRDIAHKPNFTTQKRKFKPYYPNFKNMRNISLNLPRFTTSLPHYVCWRYCHLVATSVSAAQKNIYIHLSQILKAGKRTGNCVYSHVLIMLCY